MAAWSKWAERALILDTTISYTFKPDGMMHHHYMIYGNGYPYDIIPWAARAAWMLAGSPWALKPSSVDNIARAHRVMRAFTSVAACPRSIGGRLVGSDPIAVKPPHLCVWPLLATLPDGAISERWRAASIASSWHYYRAMPESFWATTGSPARPHFQHHGCLRLLHEVKSSQNESLAALREEKLGLSNSLNIYPFAGMAVFRPLRGSDTVAVVKGFSREVKNTYERNVGNAENFYGQYQGAGSLLISSVDKTVDPISSIDGSGQPYGGMDW